MTISRAQLAKELEPGLNALFGLEYDRYEDEAAEIFDAESSDRAFEEEVMLSGFGTAPVKTEGSAINFDDAQETYTARYTMETIALAFSITEEAVEATRLHFKYLNLDGKFKVGNVENLDYHDNYFDIVFSHGVLHHVPEIDIAQKEIRRVIKNDGTLIIMLYAKHSLNF